MNQHLLSINELSTEDLLTLIELGQTMSQDMGQDMGQDRSEPRPQAPLAGETVAMLFYEASTRTRCSFELAARRLGADVLNLDIDTTSVSKGETVADTVRTLAAMGVKGFVMRHSDRAVIDAAAQALPHGHHLLNAGAGTQDHPSQTLLDLLTLARAGQDIQQLDISIVGDLRHSRVASSALQALSRLGFRRLRLGAPPGLLPEQVPDGVLPCDDLESSIKDAEVIMTLRIQRERMSDKLLGDEQQYHRDWGLSAEKIAAWAPKARIMHPGPMNRGVEIDDAVADGPNSLILEQVAQGVPARMAALTWLFSGGKAQ